MTTSTVEAGQRAIQGVETSQSDETLSIVLFSGTDDRLGAAAVLVAGAAAMGRKVNVLLQYWALTAFRRGRVDSHHGISPEAGSAGEEVLRLFEIRGGYQHWSETLRQAKEIGEVRIHACAQSMDMFALGIEDLDPLVDGVQGVAAFMADARGPVVFI
jgi:peroxiredoxin family protein